MAPNSNNELASLTNERLQLAVPNTPVFLKGPHNYEKGVENHSVMRVNVGVPDYTKKLELTIFLLEILFVLLNHINKKCLGVPFRQCNFNPTHLHLYSMLLLLLH